MKLLGIDLICQVMAALAKTDFRIEALTEFTPRKLCAVFQNKL